MNRKIDPEKIVSEIDGRGIVGQDRRNVQLTLCPRVISPDYRGQTQQDCRFGYSLHNSNPPVRTHKLFSVQITGPTIQTC